MSAEQFINPIIQAFVAGHQAAQQRAELAQRGQQFTASQEQAKQLEEERLQKEQEFRDAQLDQAHQLFDLNKALASFQHQSEILKSLQSGQEKGGNIGAQLQFLQQSAPGLAPSTPYQHLPGTGPQVPEWFSNPQSQTQNPNPQPASGSSPGTAPLPQDQSQNQSPVDLSEALGPSLQERTAMGIKSAGELAEVQEKARRKTDLEVEAQRATNAKTLEQQKIDAQKDAAIVENTFRAGESSKERQNRLDISKLDRGTQFNIAAMHETGEDRRNLFNFGIGLPSEAGASKGAINNLQDQLATGEIDYDPKNRMQFIAQSANDQHGMQPFGKKNLDELKSLNQLDDLFNQMDTVVRQGATSIPGAMGEKLKSHLVPTELANKFNTIMGQMQSVAKGAEGFSGGRILSGQFAAESGSMPQLGLPVSQNLERIDAIKRNVLNKEQSTIFAGVPITQRLMLTAKGIQAWPSTITYPDGKTGKFNKDDTLKAGHAVYDVP